MNIIAERCVCLTDISKTLTKHKEDSQLGKRKAARCGLLKKGVVKQGLGSICRIRKQYLVHHVDNAIGGLYVVE